MPICIAGMHRSGTSMVTRLLHICGLYLGDESDLGEAAPDNEEGFWENMHFSSLNDEILQQLGGGWDLPPRMEDGWEHRPDMISFRSRAADLVRQFTPREPWGWKDPRNSLTLPFWKTLMPHMKVVICLRNPLEVVKSLSKRGHSSNAFGLSLWLTYNQTILGHVLPETCIITHYDAYFHDAKAELRRVLGLLGMPAREEMVERACKALSVPLRHNRVATHQLVRQAVPGDVIQLYMKMCAQAGPVYQLAFQNEPAPEMDPALSLDPMQKGYLDALRLLRLEGQVQALTAENARLHDEIKAMLASLSWRLGHGIIRAFGWLRPTGVEQRDLGTADNEEAVRQHQILRRAG